MSELTDLFTNIADAIRTKTSKTGKIKAENFASEISNITTGEGWDTTQIRQTYYMFQANTTMTEAPYFNTENVVKMNYMFSDCTNLISVPLYNTAKVRSMNYMFSDCTSLTSVPEFDTSSVTDISYMFDGCEILETIPLFNTSSVTNMVCMFRECKKIEEIPQFDTSNVTNMNQTFNTCSELKTIPLLDCGKVNNINNMLKYCSKLTNVGGFKDLGKAYTQKTENYSNYALDLTAGSSTNYLTHDSLMNIINNLYDLNLTYDVANGGTLYRQKITLGSLRLDMLTEEEIKIATDKGWNVS